MTVQEKINAVAQLGRFISQSASLPVMRLKLPHNEEFLDKLEAAIRLAESYNGWYTEEQVRYALNAWANALTEEQLEDWLAPYRLEEKTQKVVGLVLAGNIPLVGFHDVLSVLLSGHIALIKCSSSDMTLLPLLLDYLIAIEPRFKDRIHFTEGRLENFDAVIATGSNNTARYFEYYFRGKPSIIRKSRNSVAVLTNKETPEELRALGEDIFRYFGLGCRNVSKLFVPRNYDFAPFFEAMFIQSDIIHYQKYANNYDYNKAVFLMSNFKILDNGFMTLKEDAAYASPISSVFYEYYDDLAQVQQRLEHDAEQLQCVVGSAISGGIPFGTTQKPSLRDYADGVDTIQFLTSLR